MSARLLVGSTATLQAEMGLQVEDLEAAQRFAVLDDDPTGAQTLTGPRVLLDWSVSAVLCGLAHRTSVHLLTNTRALSEDQAYAVAREAASTAHAAVPTARLILRGDSTLRGHVLAEYRAVRDATMPGAKPTLLLAMALPSAGRVTVGGVHWIEQDGRRIPVHETEYARDGIFAYRTSRLLEWAEERTNGLLRADDGHEVPLHLLRRRGPRVIAEVLVALNARGSAAACAPDAETAEDLAIIADGVEEALAAGASVVVRAAPAFVGVATSTTAAHLTKAPVADGGLLVVCGSYVEATTRQLHALVRARPGKLVEIDVEALASDHAGVEIDRIAREADALLAEGDFAIVSTPRVRPDSLKTLEAGERIALNQARAVSQLAQLPSVIVAKGGITSAVTLRIGVGASSADVVGPLLPGVSHWRARSNRGGELDYIVVPGNVGDDDLLVELVDRLGENRST